VNNIALSKLAFDGGAWVFTSNFARQFILFGLNVFFARMLLVDDFALVAVVFTFVALIQVYSEFGISIAIIQKQDLVDADFDNAIYLSMIITFLLCLLIWVFATSISSYVNQPRLSEALPFLYITAFTRGLFSVYRSFLLRRLQYKELAVTETLSVICYASIAILLLSSGPVINDLYIAHIISSIVLLVSAFYLVNRFPNSTLSLRRCRNLLSVGIWVAINRVLGQSSSYMDKFIVSANTTSVQLGGYYVCQQLASVIANNLASSVEQTVLPLYTTIDGDRLQRGYWRVFRLYVALVTPLIVIPALHAEQIIMFLYGDRWDDFSSIFQILCVGALFGSFGGAIFGSIFYSQGMTKPVVLVGIFKVLILPICLLVGSEWGLIGIAWGIVVFSILGRIFNQALLKIFFDFSLFKFFKEALKPLSMAIFLVFIDITISPLDFGFIISVFLHLSIYFIGSYFLWNKEFLLIFNKIKSLLILRRYS